MEIPGNELRIKNKIVQENSKVKAPAKNSDSGVEGAGQAPGSSDQTAFSSKAKTIQSASEAAKNAPEIRFEKVNRIKKEIADGNFHVDRNDLAEAILKDIISGA